VQERLIVALDVDSDAEALGLVEELKESAGLFKVGHQLFTAFGPEIVRRIIAAGERVFLDLKFHDIPNTVARAVAEAVKLGVSITNVHALGGLEMMKAASAAAGTAKAAACRGGVLAVTILTSMDGTSFRRSSGHPLAPARVAHLARLPSAGMDGVVASPGKSCWDGRCGTVAISLRRPSHLGRQGRRSAMTPARLAVGATTSSSAADIEGPGPAEAVRNILEEMASRYIQNIQKGVRHP
jgi:orotidine-5'-phosphate decarboxylase